MGSERLSLEGRARSGANGDYTNNDAAFDVGTGPKVLPLETMLALLNIRVECSIVQCGTLCSLEVFELMVALLRE